MNCFNSTKGMFLAYIINNSYYLSFGGKLLGARTSVNQGKFRPLVRNNFIGSDHRKPKTKNQASQTHPEVRCGLLWLSETFQWGSLGTWQVLEGKRDQPGPW